MIIKRLPLKQSSGVGVWLKYSKKLELAAKNTPGQVFFDDLINIANQCICTLTYKKLILNVIGKNGK